MSTTACDDQFNDPPIETSETDARPYVGGTPENIRAGDPYDDPAFERLAREHDVWGRAESALCAVFWLAGKAQPSSGQSAAPVGAPDRIFLVIGEDVTPDTPFSQLAEVTWCENRVNDTDIEYVRAQPAAAPVPAGERGTPDIAEFGELIDDYQCAQKDGSEDKRARARIALMAAYRAALAAPAAPRPTDDDMWDQTLRERDAYHDMADQLAAQIAAITGEEIGEHSSANDPWRNAMLAADEFIAAQIRGLCSAPAVQAAPQSTAAPSDDCDDVDAILRIVGLDPERCRTEGGALNVGRVRTLWEDVVSLAAQASGQAGPSDDEIETLARDYCDDPTVGAIVFTSTRDCVGFARALLSRYGQAPAASAEPSDEHLIETGCYQTVIERHSQPAASAEPAINGYTCTVPDDCETLHWRGQILSMNELASMAQPAVGEEIHVHIEGQDVLTLPLASSGMGTPRFVVHVPAQPAASAEPYAWMIDGSNRTWFGKFSEIEARAEARRCGGTCTAFPIFRGVQPAASAEPVPVEIERLAINRYRPVPAGALAYKVVAGDGSRSLFSGTKDECQIVARKLTEAFLDGAHVAINAAPVADQAPQDERMETTSEHIARDIREGRFPQRSEPQRVQATEWGPMPDAGVEADAHVAVIEGDEAVRVLRWNSDVGAFSYPVGTRLYAAQAPAADGDALDREKLIDAVEEAISVGPMDTIHADDRHAWGNTWHMEPPPEPRADHVHLQGRRSCATRAVDAMLAAMQRTSDGGAA